MSSDREEDRRSVLATIGQLRGQLQESLELSDRDREAARAVAAGLRDAKAANTRRVYASAWHEFNAWALANGRQSLPAEPRTGALYLGRLAADGRAMATIALARAAISHAHVAGGTAKGDNPARHPVVAETVKGWRESGASAQAGQRPHLRGTGTHPGDRPTSPARPRRTDGDAGRGPVPGRRRPGNHRSDGRWRSEAIGSRSTGLGGRGILAGRDGPPHGPEGQESAGPGDTVALTETTARALLGIQPDGADPAAPVFGLTGETLANRIRAAARAARLGEDFSGTAAASAWRGGWLPQERGPRRFSTKGDGSTAIWSPATLGARPQGRR